MLNKLLNWLFPEPDWVLIEVIQGEWIVTNRTNFGKYKSAETSIYEFYYSKSKNEYKLEISGYKPKEHDEYITAIKRLNELKNESKIIKETP